MLNGNSFQRWANNHARKFGFIVTRCGNWVKLHRDGVEHECMTVKGVEAVCRNAEGV